MEGALEPLFVVILWLNRMGAHLYFLYCRLGAGAGAGDKDDGDAEGGEEANIANRFFLRNSQ